MLRTTVLMLAALLSPATKGSPERLREFRLPSGVTITIGETPFIAGHFKVKGCLREGQSCEINGHVPFGRASAMPATYVSRMTLSFGGAKYSLDSSDMYDAWGERPLEYPGKARYLGGRCTDSSNCCIRGLFSDGGGTFVAEWQVVNGRPIRTVLTDSNDVVNLFMKDIDPPTFE